MNVEDKIKAEAPYIPETGIRYPDNPHDFLLHPKHLREVTVDEKFPFLDKSLKARLYSKLIYTIIFFVVFWLNPLRYGLKIVGKENISKNRKLFKNGAITIGNHVYRWDFLSILQAVKFRRLWFPARAENLAGSDANIIRGAGGIPIPSGSTAMRKFNEAFDELHEKKKWLHFFPEGSRWDFYAPIRPFHKGAFAMAQKYNIPIIPFAFSYREPTGFYKWFKVKHPLITLHVGTPIVPNSELSRKESILQMLKDAHAQIVQMAGIRENPWPASDT